MWFGCVAQNVIFKQLQSGARVSIWLYDNTEQRIEGKIIVSKAHSTDYRVIWCGRVGD